MKSADKMRRFFDSATVQTNAAPDDALFETIQTTYARTVERKSAQREPRAWSFLGRTSARLAVAAVILMAFGIGFSTGRWSKPTRGTPYTLDITGYPSAIPAPPTTSKAEDGFWRQKALAAMQPKPYLQIQAAETRVLDLYKQYRKERHHD